MLGLLGLVGSAAWAAEDDAPEEEAPEEEEAGPEEEAPGPEEAPAPEEAPEEEAPGPEEAPAPEEAPDPASDDALAPHRVDLDVLMDRTIGTASRPLVFDWRESRIQLGASGHFLVELNLFDNARVGGVVRVPTGGTLLEVGVAAGLSGDTVGSRQVALTPFRQPGRPDRVELDVLWGIPLAEGIVTAATRFVPATHLVLQGYLGVRYRVYPTGFGGLRPGQVLGAVVNPRLSEAELENLEGVRLGAMDVDAGRYDLVAGVGTDVYLAQGIFLSPRLLFHVPVLAPASDTQLLFWMDAGLVLGVAL